MPGIISGDLTPGCAAVVTAVLESLSAPMGAEDTRTREQRYHDGLQEAMRRLVASGLLPERAGQPVKMWAHVSLAELRAMDDGSLLETEWVTEMRIRWAAHRAGASGGAGSDGAAWLDGDAARAMACDAQITPIVTGDVDPGALDDLVRLCLHWPATAPIAQRGPPRTRPAVQPSPASPDPPAAASDPDLEPGPSGLDQRSARPGRRSGRPLSAKPRFFYCTLDRRLTCGNVHDEDIASLRHPQPAVLFWRIPAAPRLHVPRLDPGWGWRSCGPISWAWGAGLGSGQQFAGQGVGHGGGAAGHVEFGEDVLDVVLGGAPADVQGLADVGVGGAVGEQPQYLELA